MNATARMAWKSPSVRRRWAAAMTAALLAALATLGAGGCTAPQAAVNILSAAEEAVRANLHADQVLSEALAGQSRDQQAALDRAFLADFRRLAEQREGVVAIGDIEQGKALYDRQLAAILASRDAVGELFRKKHLTQQAAMDLIQKARRLSSGEIEVRNELEKTQQEVSRLLQAAFPALNRATAPAGAGGGIQP